MMGMCLPQLLLIIPCIIPSQGGRSSTRLIGGRQRFQGFAPVGGRARRLVYARMMCEVLDFLVRCMASFCLTKQGRSYDHALFGPTSGATHSANGSLSAWAWRS